MNKIGIIFAMREELDELLKNINITHETTIYNITFYEATIYDKECILVESGVGKVNSSRITQLLIDKFNPDCVFNIGVAGSVSEDVLLTHIVVGEKMVCYDFDITAFDHEKGYIPGIGVYINNSNELINISKSLEEENVHYGIIASGDKFVTDKNESENISKEFNALCVEMEGSSISQVCFLCNVPCLVIRSISDTIYKDNNKEIYENLLNEASKKVSDYLLKLLRRIK